MLTLCYMYHCYGFNQQRISKFNYAMFYIFVPMITLLDF